MGHDDLKVRHELAVASLFADYLRGRGVPLANLRNGDPRLGEPDVLADGPGGAHGIEIADGWMSDADARATWGLVRERADPSRTLISSSGLEAELSPIIAGPDQQLAAGLQVVLERHCLRSYGMPTYLVLNASQAPLTSAEDAPSIISQLRVPAASRMAGVFLVLTRNFSWVRECFELTSST